MIKNYKRKEYLKYVVRSVGVSSYLTVYKEMVIRNLYALYYVHHQNHGIMINFIKKAPKWPKMIKTDSAYLHSFSKAVLNFEQNILEERRLKEISKSRNSGLRPESHF